MRLFTKALLLSTVLIFASCTKTGETADSTQSAAATAAVVESTVPSTAVPEDRESRRKLLFFINPNGRPCQMQDQILKSMGSSLTDNAGLEYISTTDMKNSRPLFMQYGVRALPTLILLNEDGSVNRRFTPGIIDAETISSALN